MNAIEINNLRKSFGDFEAVKGVSFSVQQGEVFSLLGPNGAGKTTTMERLTRTQKRKRSNVPTVHMKPCLPTVKLT